MKDGKNSFYRNLSVDKDTKAIIRWLRENKKAILNAKHQHK